MAIGSPGGCAGSRSAARSPVVRVKATPGWPWPAASPSRRWPCSRRARDFMNLSRAGVAVEQLAHFDARAGGERRRLAPPACAPPSTVISYACGRSRGREAMASRPPTPIEGSASPRKPRVAMIEKDRRQRAWRWRGARPRAPGRRRPCRAPSSVTRISARPPAAATTSMSRGAGIDRVLDQLLDHARRPLDHLAGGDAVDEFPRQLADGHGMPPSAAPTPWAALPHARG